MSTNPIDVFLNAVDEADAAVRVMHLAAREGGADISEGNLARRLRSIDSALAEIRDEVETVGLTA